ncbi:MAG: Rossmann-like and DUF2520 domain-containing protein [Tannerellaceae bacterium]
MKVVILGAGNLATRLSLEMHRKGMRIAQVFSQTETSAKALAKRLGAMPITDLSAVDTDADLYIFALKDSILESVLTQMNTTSGLWVHTAGSIPMELLTQYHDRCGVLYPLQSFSKTREVDFAVIPVFIEAQHAEDLKMLKKISGALTERVVELSSEKRKKLHLAAVFANNFTNHMYAQAASILEGEGLRFDYLVPLIDETASKIHEMQPIEAQTGPAIRYDESVIEKHIDMLADQDSRDIYAIVSKSIHNLSQKENE